VNATSAENMSGIRVKNAIRMTTGPRPKYGNAVS
jgi:hypothetical protein